MDNYEYLRFFLDRDLLAKVLGGIADCAFCRDYALKSDSCNGDCVKAWKDWLARKYNEEEFKEIIDV